MIFFEIDTKDLKLSFSELRRRLQVPDGFDLDFVKEVQENITSLIHCKMAAVKIPVKIYEDVVDAGFGAVESKNLKMALEGCSEAYVFAVTLGMDVDRYLLRLSKISVGEMYLADSMASAYAEAAADHAQELLLGKKIKKIRFSPGYGDLPLECQKEILKLLDAQNKLGITLTDSLLMKPQKSITAIVGI